MENPCGARLEFWHQDGKFGLGSFYYKGVRAGAEMDQFLYEDSHYVWDKYQADRYEIVENTPQKGVITFYGTFGAINIESNWLVTVTLTAGSPAYLLEITRLRKSPLLTVMLSQLTSDLQLMFMARLL